MRKVFCSVADGLWWELISWLHEGQTCFSMPQLRRANFCNLPVLACQQCSDTCSIAGPPAGDLYVLGGERNRAGWSGSGAPQEGIVDFSAYPYAFSANHLLIGFETWHTCYSCCCSLPTSYTLATLCGYTSGHFCQFLFAG